MFILHKAAEQLDVGVSESEINGRIAQIAFERNMRPEVLRQELIQRNQIGTVFQQIREHKTLDAIVAKAQVAYMPADDYNKWAKEETEKRGGGAKKSSGGSKKKSEPKAESSDEGEEKPKKTTKKKS